MFSSQGRPCRLNSTSAYVNAAYAVLDKSCVPHAAGDSIFTDQQHLIEKQTRPFVEDCPFHGLTLNQIMSAEQHFYTGLRYVVHLRCRDGNALVSGLLGNGEVSRPRSWLQGCQAVTCGVHAKGRLQSCEGRSTLALCFMCTGFHHPRFCLYMLMQLSYSSLCQVCK